jgi:hypothetical protein
MKPEDLDELTKQIEHGVERLMTRQNANMHEKLKTMIDEATKQAVNPSTTDLKRMSNLMGDIEHKIEAMEGVEFNLQYVPFLDKGESPQQWLRTFQSCNEFKGYDRQRQIKAFKMLMRNSAATWFDELEKELDNGQKTPDQKWDEIKRKFIERFDKGNTWLEEHLIQFVNQKSGEPVQKYYSGLLERAGKLNKSKTELLTLFIRGLEPQIKLYVLAREPADLEAAFNLAKAGESLQMISDLTANRDNDAGSVKFPGEIGNNPLSASRFSMTDMCRKLTELSNKVSEMNRHPKDTNFKQPPRQTGSMKCFHCGIPGHRARECRSRLNSMQRSRVRPTYHRQPLMNARPAQIRGQPQWPRRPQTGFTNRKSAPLN